MTADGPVLTGAGEVLGKLAAAGFILVLLSSGTTWLMGADRSQAVAGYDGAGPRILGTFSKRWGTPIVVNFLSGIVSTIVMVLAFQLSGGDSEKYFNAVLNVVLLFTTISYIVIFPALIKLRYSHGHVERPYKVPFGMAGVWICGVLTTFWAVLASVVGLFPGLGDGSLLNDEALPEGFSRGTFQLVVFIPLIVTVVIGLLFYWAGRETREQPAQGPHRRADPAGARAGLGARIETPARRTRRARRRACLQGVRRRPEAFSTMRSRLLLLAPMLVLLAVPSPGLAQSGGTPVPAATGGAGYGHKVGKLVATRFTVTPGTLQPGSPATFRYRIDGPPRTVRVRIDLLPDGGRHPAKRLRLGYKRTGRSLTYTWTPAGRRADAGRLRRAPRGRRPRGPDAAPQRARLGQVRARRRPAARRYARTPAAHHRGQRRLPRARRLHAR